MTNYKARVGVEGDPPTNYIIALEKETSSLKWMQKVQFNDREDSEYQDIGFNEEVPISEEALSRVYFMVPACPLPLNVKL